MAKVSVSIPDDVVASAKAAGLNISRLATQALSAELDRRSRIEALDAHLAELERELGPIPEHDARQAGVWAERFDRQDSSADGNNDPAA